MRLGMAVIGAAMLASCQTTESVPPSPHPFVGCWESESGLSREGWTIDPSGWLVGYAINRDKDGTVKFYESMRVERGGGQDVFVATGADGSTTRFTREDTGKASEFRFVNAAHDFPQVIVYRASSGRLDAEISSIDGTNRVEFLKAACEAE